jgi:hypothetical protein
VSSSSLATALSLWESWRGSKKAPTWQDVELYEFPSSLLPMVTVVDVLDDGRDFKYRFWGSELSRLFGREETGLLLSEHAVSESGKIRFSQFKEVISRFQPALFMTIFEKSEGSIAKKLNLRLPIADEPDKVTKIITLSTIQRIGLQNHEILSELWLGELEAEDPAET